MASDQCIEWRPVVGMAGLMSVSSCGLVRREIASPSNPSKHPAGSLISPGNRHGYPVVRFTLHGRIFRKYVHVLVAEAFISPKPHRFVVNHKNSVRNDNRVENLEYVTQRQNIHHGRDRGHYAWKLNPESVREIRSLRRDGMIFLEIARKYSVSMTTIQRICNGRNWSHVKD